MVAVTFPKCQVGMCCDGSKRATLRKPSFKVTNDVVKFLNNFKYGVFAEAPIEFVGIISVNDIDDSLAQDLGYSSRDEYLANGWNEEYDERLLIRWGKISVNWDVVEKLGVIEMGEGFEEFVVNFKIVSNDNNNIYVDGYVTIYDENAEDVDWQYWNGNGWNQQMTIFHDEVDIKGATYEQTNEIEKFMNDLDEDDEWLTDAILQSDENETGEYVRENVTLYIGGSDD